MAGYRREPYGSRFLARAAGLLRRTAFGYSGAVISLAARLNRAFTWALLGVGMLCTYPAVAQDLLPGDSLAALPTFAMPQRDPSEESRWTGSYARMSTGFEVVSSKRYGGYAGPTIGFEGGRMWQSGELIYGLVGGFNYLDVIGGGATPRFAGLSYTQDFSGALQFKVGRLLTPDVLLYAKIGGEAVHDKLRFGATAFRPSFSRDDIAIRPDARVGVEWAVTDQLSVAVEAGVTRTRTGW
jgi:outer membrane immunogenic protein